MAATGNSIGFSNDISNVLSTLENIRDILQDQLLIKLYYINETMTNNGWRGNTSNNFNLKSEDYYKSLNSLCSQINSIIIQIRGASDIVQDTASELSNGM